MSYSPFFVLAFGDKVLVDGTVRYMQFFDIDDHPVLRIHKTSNRSKYRAFATPNGSHIVGKQIVSPTGKRRFYLKWKNRHPNADYKLANWNWLKPQSEEELKFIQSLIQKVDEYQVCTYYRDKRVFEKWDSDFERANTRD